MESWLEEKRKKEAKEEERKLLWFIGWMTSAIFLAALCFVLIVIWAIKNF